MFDSGVGGLTVLKRVLERHRETSTIYLADNARMPYGDKSPEEIRSIAVEVTEWLTSQRVSAILMACNTTNSLALDIVERLGGVPVIDLIHSAGAMVCEEKVGVLATQATVSTNLYSKIIKRFRPGTLG